MAHFQKSAEEIAQGRAEILKINGTPGYSMTDALTVYADAASGSESGRARLAILKSIDPSVARLLPDAVDAIVGKSAPRKTGKARKTSRRERLRSMLESPDQATRDYALTQLTGGR